MSRMIDKKRKLPGIILITGGIVLVAMVIQAVILSFINNRSFDRTSQVLLDQVSNVIEKNKASEEDLIDSLKEDYMVRAKAVAYIVDAKPEVANDVEELRKIAALIAVDEVHLFNTDGVIYAGTNPEYFGYSFDSGEQMAYFKPMLDDKNLTMCQDVTPNTSKGKKMMYAITWNDDGTKMIQVGIEPRRLLNEVKQNEIYTVVANMPMYDGLSVVVADGESGEIYGCSYKPVVGLTLDEIGISVTDDMLPDDEDSFTGIRRINGFRNRCVFRRSGEYVIGVIYRMDVNSRSNMAIMVIMALYLCFAAGLVVSMVMKVIRANRERNEQLSILTSMSGMYYSMHMLDIRHDTFALYTAGDLILRAGERAAGAKELMRKIVHKVVVDEHQASAQEFMDLDSLGDRLIKKKIVSGEFMVKDLGWFRLSFISIDVDEDGRPLKVIFTTRNIDEDKKREQKLIRRSYTDELTKCYNRSAYIDDVRELPGDSVYVYVSMDVNGLKSVNDTLGHAAGDELLQGAAECMEQCFGNYGKVYRMGGDEFAAIIFVNTRRLKRVQQEFDDVVRGWSGQQVKSISISCGYVSSDEKDWESFDEIVKAADERMYENKAAYYRQEGVDRRYH